MTRAQAEKGAVIIREVFYAKVKVLNFEFMFPIHCHPEDIALPILGNDFLSLVDMSVNVATSTITLPIFAQFRTEAENFKVLSRQSETKADEYLLSNLAVLSAGKEVLGLSSEVMSISVKGTELNFNEFFLYPDTSVDVICSQRVQLPCHTSGIPFRKGKCYTIRAVTRGILGDLEVLSPTWVQTEADTDTIKIPVTTETAVSLSSKYPCAIAQPLTEAHVEAVYVMSNHSEPPQDDEFPEFSKFEPETWHPDLPLPLTPETCKQVVDYTTEEWDELHKEMDKWIVIEGDKAFMTPCDLVKIPIMSTIKEFGDFRRHAMLSKQMSTLLMRNLEIR
jgi:hypothetical protein